MYVEDVDAVVEGGRRGGDGPMEAVDQFQGDAWAP